MSETIPTFDFISAREFRGSLEADYNEMLRCSKAQAWKAVQVLAGSIIEALLIDYLVATNSPPRAGKDPLKMDLSEAITVCKTEKVVSERNVARIRRTAFGPTAEHILKKVSSDQDSLSILKHLVEDMNTQERERLLLEVIPPRYTELQRSDPEPFSEPYEESERLQRAFRTVLETLPDDSKRRIAARFVDLLRNADGETIRTYRDGFFKADDLQYLDIPSRALVKQHLLSSAPHQVTDGYVEVGLGEEGNPRRTHRGHV